MKKKLYYAARWQLDVPGSAGTDGSVIFSSGIPSNTLTRRFKNALPRLHDPQVYLRDLQPDRCQKSCSRLASYAWFRAAGAPIFDSGRHKQVDWNRREKQNVAHYWNPPMPGDTAALEAAAKACAEFQLALGCEALILPSPLTRNPSTDYDEELEWLEAGLAHARRLAPSTPTLATIAISDTCLGGMKPDTNRLLEIIVDQVSSRAQGAYIVLEQSNERGYSCNNENTVSSILHLVSELKAGGLKNVVVAFAGVAGLAAICAGADSWVTGWYRGERRLRLMDMEDQEGRAYPAYYVHQLAAEIHLKDDLSRIARANLLDRVIDNTPASATLIASMRTRNQPPPDWQAVPGNVLAARTHFMQALVRETERVSAFHSDSERKSYGRDWLSGAAQLAAALTAVGNFNERTEITHQRAWSNSMTTV